MFFVPFGQETQHDPRYLLQGAYKGHEPRGQAPACERRNSVGGGGGCRTIATLPPKVRERGKQSSCTLSLIQVSSAFAS